MKETNELCLFSACSLKLKHSFVAGLQVLFHGLDIVAFI
jgi:hypothetical protein